MGRVEQVAEVDMCVGVEWYEWLIRVSPFFEEREVELVTLLRPTGCLITYELRLLIGSSNRRLVQDLLILAQKERFNAWWWDTAPLSLLWSIEDIGLFAEEGIPLIIIILNDLRLRAAVFDPKSIALLFDAHIRPTRRYPHRLLLCELNFANGWHNDVFDSKTVPAGLTQSFLRCVQCREFFELKLLEGVSVAYVAGFYLNRLIDLGLHSPLLLPYILPHDDTFLFAGIRWDIVELYCTGSYWPKRHPLYCSVVLAEVR